MPVMVVVKRQRLLPVGGIIGVVEIQRDAGRCTFITGDELPDQRAGHAVDIAAAQRAFQAGEGGTTSQQIVCIQRRPTRSQLEQRTAAQRVGVIAVFIA